MPKTQPNLTDETKPRYPLLSDEGRAITAALRAGEMADKIITSLQVFGSHEQAIAAAQALTMHAGLAVTYLAQALDFGPADLNAMLLRVQADGAEIIERNDKIDALDEARQIAADDR